MPFLLSRSGRNIPAEVQRWQYFLLKNGITQVGPIDGRFGQRCEVATKFFQTKHEVRATGALDGATLGVAEQLGYTVLPDDYYKQRGGPDWPPKPRTIKSPSNAWRNATFHCFEFTQLARRFRESEESIVIGGSCDGATRDWTKTNIVEVDIKQLHLASGYPGHILCHTLAADHFVALFDAWKEADLLHLVVKYEGCFVPRYKRHQSPGDAAQPKRRSVDVARLSNHSFGSAMDMNYGENTFPATPALCGQFGSTRELVEPAAKLGFYWGGFFQDGNHFELARLS